MTTCAAAGRHVHKAYRPGDRDPGRRQSLDLCVRHFGTTPKPTRTPLSASPSCTALARASGLGGMAGGQMLDFAAEGRFATAAERLGLAEIQKLQAMKTGALLRFGCVAGTARRRRRCSGR